MKTATKAKIAFVAGLSALEILIGGILPFLGTKPEQPNFAYEAKINPAVVEKARPGLGGLVNGIFSPESALAEEQGQIGYKNTIRDQLNKNDYSGAILTCDSALKSYSNDADFWYFKGFILKKLGKSEEAMEAYKIADRIKPYNAESTPLKNSDAKKYYELGIEQKKESKDYNLAIDSFRESSKLEKENPQPLYEIGACYVLLGDYSKGIQYLEKALETKPDNMALNAIATAHFMNKNWSEALFYSNLILSLLPPDYVNRGVIEERKSICEKYL
jgi:tetratricopeptide (TPR) repeat protein